MYTQHDSEVDAQLFVTLQIPAMPMATTLVRKFQGFVVDKAEHAAFAGGVTFGPLPKYALQFNPPKISRLRKYCRVIRVKTAGVIVLRVLGFESSSRAQSPPRPVCLLCKQANCSSRWEWDNPDNLDFPMRRVRQFSPIALLNYYKRVS